MKLVFLFLALPLVATSAAFSSVSWLASQRRPSSSHNRYFLIAASVIGSGDESPDTMNAAYSVTENSAPEITDMIASNKEPFTLADDLVVLPKEPLVFKPHGHVPLYQWKIPTGTGPTPAMCDFAFDKLLRDNFFFDKSTALHNLLQRWFDFENGDFDRASLHLVYPRRFGKTNLLQFIEAVFSPVPRLYSRTLDEIKTRIASLDKGKELLQFGMHPVVRLSVGSVWNVEELLSDIGERLVVAGLDEEAVKKLKTAHSDPSSFLQEGIAMLNDKFRAQFQVATKTIVLFDRYDSLFRTTRLDNDPLLVALRKLYGLGSEGDSGISILVLCGLSRMVGSTFLKKHKFVDLSRQSKYHGLCGISVREIVHSCNAELDKYANDNFKGQTLEQHLVSKFVPAWNGFRFGMDEEVGWLDPNLPEATLFSPLDAWQIVQSVACKKKQPSSRWISSMGCEFEFTSLAHKYTSSLGGIVELYRTLEGGWLDTSDPDFNMERYEFKQLSTNESAQKLFWELGLLSVKEVCGNMVRIGSPNAVVTRNARLMVRSETKQEVPTVELAREYLSCDGFGHIVSNAASEVSKLCRGIPKDVRRIFPFQDFLYSELLYRFPDETIGRDKYQLYRKAPVPVAGEWIDKDELMVMIVTLLYEYEESTALMIEVGVAEISESDSDAIATAHQGNLVAAKARIQSYAWGVSTTLQRVVVSGVWHPKGNGSRDLTLSTSYEFVG